jgi:hypothetical protein
VASLSVILRESNSPNFVPQNRQPLKAFPRAAVRRTVPAMNAKKPAVPIAPISRLNAGHKASLGWRMRVEGHTWDEIARATGYYDGATAYRAVKTYFGSVPVVDHEMQRQIARERTEFVQQRALQLVEMNPTPANIHAAVDTLRRAAQLDGLDAAMKVAVEVTPDEVREVAAYMLSLAGKEFPEEADIFSDEYNVETVAQLDRRDDDAGQVGAVRHVLRDASGVDE